MTFPWKVRMTPDVVHSTTYRAAVGAGPWPCCNQQVCAQYVARLAPTRMPARVARTLIQTIAFQTSRPRIATLRWARAEQQRLAQHFRVASMGHTSCWWAWSMCSAKLDCFSTDELEWSLVHACSLRCSIILLYYHCIYLLVLNGPLASMLPNVQDEIERCRK